MITSAETLRPRTRRNDWARLLVAGQVGLDEVVAGPHGAVLLDVLADGFRRQRHHVLAGGIRGEEVEVEEDVVALDGDAQVVELAEPRGALGGRAEVLHVFGGPEDEQAGLAQVVEREPRSAADAFVEEDGRAATGLGEQMTPSAVRGDERRLGRRQGHVVVAAGVQTVDPQRASQADGNLDGADEVFDVLLEALLAGQCVGIEQFAPVVGRHAEHVPAPLDGLIVDERAARYLRWDIIGVRRQPGKQFLAAAIAENALEMTAGLAAVGGHGLLLGH